MRSSVGALASGGYFANAVNFNGSTYLTAPTITGQANSTFWCGSIWIKPSANGTNMCVLYDFESSTNKFFYVYKLANNSIQFVAKGTSGNTILSVSSSASSILSGNWYNVLWFFNMTNPSQRYLYINDVSDLATVTTYTNESIDFTLGSPGWSIGANGALVDRWNGDMADIWMISGYGFLFSNEGARRHFISSSGKPVDLGSTGGKPVGVDPLIFLSGPTVDWHLNKASSGFTETGALTDATTSPSG